MIAEQGYGEHRMAAALRHDQSNTLLVQRAGLTRLLREGQNSIKPISNYMPPVGRGWTPFQITALIAFMKTHIYKAAATSGG